MVAQIITGSVQGIEAQPVTVEVDLSGGLPGLAIVGLPDAIVNESRERLRAALRNNGFSLPNKKIIINLAPASLRKEGTGLDLPLALGILKACDLLPEGEHALLNSAAWVGELALDGSLRAVPGVLAMAIMAKEHGFEAIVVPEATLKEASLVEGLQVYGLKHLGQLAALLSSPETFASPYHAEALLAQAKSQGKVVGGLIDFSAIRGQSAAKRALEIAAAGGHNTLMQGPPGSGKSLLAKALAGILPPLSLQEAIEVSRIYSVAGLLTPEAGLIYQRPFRAPHHTASAAGLSGGGSFPKPGELTLAHRGVLFLDEIVEFPRPLLELLRQPLEDGCITISRAQKSHQFPARSMVIAAMNPCPCGYRGDTRQACVCRDSYVERYVSKISGPLLDRMDLHIEVPRLKEEELLDERQQAEPSSVVRERVIRARAIQMARYEELGYLVNAELGPGHLDTYCALNNSTRSLLESAMRRLKLSARAVGRLRRVARTIADLEASPTVEAPHLAEALQYRGQDLLEGSGGALTQRYSA